MFFQIKTNIYTLHKETEACFSFVSGDTVYYGTFAAVTSRHRHIANGGSFVIDFLLQIYGQL